VAGYGKDLALIALHETIQQFEDEEPLFGQAARTMLEEYGDDADAIARK